MSAPDIVLSEPYGSLRARINSFVFFVFLALVPIIGHAGGLGMAPLAAIIGGAGWLLVTNFKGFKPNFAVFVFFAFLIWASLTSLWSPYDNENFLSNPVKLLIGVVFYLGSFAAVKSVNLMFPVRFLHGFIAINVFMCGLIIFDQLSNYGLTFLFDPQEEGRSLYLKLRDANMNIGHSVTMAAVFLGPVIALVLKNFKRNRMWVCAYAVLLLWAAYLSSLAVGILSVLLIVMVCFAALKWPHKALSVAIYVAIASIAFAPLIGVISGGLSDEFIKSLPLSWEHRVIMWDYTQNRIWEHPFIGHGFDAVRTFNETIPLGTAKEWPIVSLHPHNAGMHIWVETGLVGVFFACFSLFLIGRHISPLAAHSKYFAVAMSGFILGVTLVSAVTYGVWQHWWWATIIFTSAIIHGLFINSAAK